MDAARERHLADEEVAHAGPVADERDQADAARDQQAATKASSAAIADEAAKAKDQTQQENAVAPVAADVADDAAADADPAAAVADPVGSKITLGGVGHVVIKGDIPWDISKHYYGEGKYWTVIKKANAAKFKKGLAEGTVLDIPAVELDTLSALLRFKDQPKTLCDMIRLMPLAEYEGFFDQLTPAQIDKYGTFLQLLELNRATGKTVKELSADQRTFLKEKAAAEQKDVGESVGEVVETEGYGGAEAKFWKKQKGPQRKDWKRRFRAAVKDVKATAPADVQEIITTAEKKGGGFRWSPQEIEENEAFAYTYADSWELHCGVEWVIAAEQDPVAVYGNIAHEMGGHNYYGDELGYEIQLGAMTAKEEKAAEKSGNSIYSAYGYMETEIFSELYEFPYNFPDTEKLDYPSDTAFDTDTKGRPVSGGKNDPLGDTYEQLKRIRAAFAPDIANGLVQSLGRRVKLDPRIIPEAKQRFHDAVIHVFVAPP